MVTEKGKEKEKKKKINIKNWLLTTLLTTVAFELPI